MQFGAGEDEETAFMLSIQPVVPIRLGKINLVNRPIIPLMFMPGAVVGLPENGGDPEGFGDTFGLGDINITAFISPADSGKLIGPVGPGAHHPEAVARRHPRPAPVVVRGRLGPG